VLLALVFCMAGWLWYVFVIRLNLVSPVIRLNLLPMLLLRLPLLLLLLPQLL
jgi:hypothetical protein